VDRAKNGSKHHLIVDAGGVPLACTLTGANEHDVTQLIPLVEAVPPVRGRPGAPLRKPKLVVGDRGYDSDPHRMRLSGRGIATAIARRGTPHGSGLGIFRYVVEQTIALLHQMRRLRTRFERRDDIHLALMKLGCISVCHTRLTSSFF
jgi:transposase